MYESFGMNICFPYVANCIMYLFVYITRWRIKPLTLMQWINFCLVSTFKSSYACLYFIILYYIK